MNRTDVPVPLDDFEVCTRCTRLRGPFVWITGKGSRYRNVQECRCQIALHEERPERWVSFDINEVVELCRVCGGQALRSGSKYSVWLCPECQPRAKDLNTEIGRVIIPFGRHSVHASMAITARQLTDPAARSEFAHGIVGLFHQTTVVHDWAEHAVRRNLVDLRLESRSAVPVLEYLELAAGVDRARRFEECLSFILERSDQQEASGA